MPFIVRYVGLRFLAIVPLLLGVVTATFLVVHLIPGSPVYEVLGAGSSQETIKAAINRLGLDKPLYIQYLDYIRALARGDLGTSLFTGQPVTQDLAQRFPLTLELITLSMTLGVGGSFAVGVICALRPDGIVDRAVKVFAFLAGSIPDFWLALILVYAFYTTLHWAPAPIGALGLNPPPTHITGMYLVDSLLTGDVFTASVVASHYVLPVVTLAVVYGTAVLKMVRQTMISVLESDVVRFANVSGLSRVSVARIALRNSLPPVVTVAGVTFGYLLGGAVLVETVFSWGGLGQYAVQAIEAKDYVAIQGFVLVAATFSILVYLILDLIYMIIDPRLVRSAQ